MGGFFYSLNGQQLKCLTVIEGHTREALAIDMTGNIRSEHVIKALSRLVSDREGQPRPYARITPRSSYRLGRGNEPATKAWLWNTFRNVHGRASSSGSGDIIKTKCPIARWAT